MMDENEKTIEEVVACIDEIIADLAGFTFPYPATAHESISPDAVARIDKFNA
jgi:hypothetical protein